MRTLCHPSLRPWLVSNLRAIARNRGNQSAAIVARSIGLTLMEARQILIFNARQP